MKRRDFVTRAALLSAGIGFVPSLVKNSALAQTTTSTPVTSPSGKPILVIGKGKDYEALTTKVLEPLGGLAAFVKKGEKVVIKPNIGWDRAPEQAANTHPLVVKTLAKTALDLGAAQVLIFDRTCNEKTRCYTNSGIEEAISSLGDSRVKCVHIDDRKFVNTPIPNGKAVKEWPIYGEVLEADCYINVPIAKHHKLAKLTLGLKNIMGVLGAKRGEIHTDIAQKLADLNGLIKPRVTIIDATRILTDHGPSGGNLEDVKVLDTLIASTDPVAADAYATTLFGMKPEDLPSTIAAHQAGLGEMDLSKVNMMTV